jgi:hypothetical protein
VPGSFGGDLAPTAGVSTVDEAFLRRAAQKAPAPVIVDVNAPIPLEELPHTSVATPTAFDTAGLAPVPEGLVPSDDEILSRPLRPAAVRPTLRAVPLVELDQQWDDFMEWLPRGVRDKLYNSSYRALSELLAVPKHQLRQQFAPNELLFIEDALKQMGHPLRDTAPASTPRAVRFRNMRRG